MSQVQFIALLAYLALVSYTIKHLDIRRLFSDRKIQHLLFGSAAGLFTLWWFRTGIYDGLTVHFLWFISDKLF